jgi:hypothetical protein
MRTTSIILSRYCLSALTALAMTAWVSPATAQDRMLDRPLDDGVGASIAARPRSGQSFAPGIHLGRFGQTRRLPSPASSGATVPPANLGSLRGIVRPQGRHSALRPTSSLVRRGALGGLLLDGTRRLAVEPASDGPVFDRHLRQRTDRVDQVVTEGLGVLSNAPGMVGRCSRVAEEGYKTGASLRSVQVPGTGGMTLGDLSAGVGEVMGSKGFFGYLKYCADYWFR